MLLQWLNQLTWSDGAIGALVAVIAWVAVQWRKSEELKQKAEELRLRSDELRLKTEEARSSLQKSLVDAEKRALEAENAALEIKNEMPSIVAEYFEKTEKLFADKFDQLRERLQRAMSRVRELETELRKLKSQSMVSEDDLRRLADEVENTEEEVQEISRFAAQVEQRRDAISKILSVLKSPELAPDLMEATEAALNRKLRLSEAAKTTARVVEREHARAVAKSASTNAKFKAMEERLEMVERKLKAAGQQAMRLPLHEQDGEK